MKLARDARKWHRLWSVRLAVIAAGLAALETTLPLWSETVPDNVFAAMSTVVAVAAAIARVIHQSDIHDE